MRSILSKILFISASFSQTANLGRHTQKVLSGDWTFLTHLEDSLSFTA
jgi:hypothetical protein